MAYPQNSEVQLPVPISTLIKAIEQLSTEALWQLLHATEAALAARASHQPEAQVTQVEDERFWQSELSQYISAEADARISIEEVRKALSVIPGSLVEDISRERNER
jgi:hypothetical protein